MAGPGLVHIVNFIRGCEPRGPVDLVEATREELRWTRELGLPATWLFQYDALVDPAFTELFADAAGDQELGLWFEFPQALVERAGLVWRGRYPWDWHAHVGFSIGYAPEERRRMADLAVEEFARRFRRRPTAAGSWLLDARLLAHLADRHDFAAFCVCKDQWGTDGYSLWGGYWNGAYFPSRANAFMPAQNPRRQIHVPVYRMLGSDPIYQYDFGGFGGAGGPQAVATLEPVYREGGGSPAWVRWFFATVFDGPSLDGGYAQAGQENSFGWKQIGPGYADQLALIAQWRDAGKIRVATMSESGRGFSARHPLTPAAATVALRDWKREGRATAWYNSRHYRLNLHRDPDGGLRLRDYRLFDERYAERYLDAVCPDEHALYDTLPLIDAYLWAGGPDAAAAAEPTGGLFLRPDGRPLVCGPWRAGEGAADELWIEAPLEGGGGLTMRCVADETIFAAERPFDLAWRWREPAAPRVTAEPGRLRFAHEGHAYALAVPEGEVALIEGRPRLRAVAGRLRLRPTAPCP